MPTTQRTTVLYVIIDRPQDIQPGWHDPNFRGVHDAVAAFDPTLTLLSVTIADLDGMDSAAIDAKWSPFAVFSAGSWSEWFNYGTDADWKRRLDNYMAFIRATTIPIHAVCGSHQLVAAAFNGWSSVAHMNDTGAPTVISTELAANAQQTMTPNPRVGETGSYPIALTGTGAADPVVTALGAAFAAPMTSLHHCDEVVDTTGFTLLWVPDLSRAPATTGADQAVTRCQVQGMVRADSMRVLYATQFHPEMSRFPESVGDDGGFGQAWLMAFFGVARAFWTASAGGAAIA